MMIKVMSKQNGAWLTCCLGLLTIKTVTDGSNNNNNLYCALGTNV